MNHPIGASSDPAELALRFDIVEGVAVVTIDQPNSRANILTPLLWADLGALFTALVPRTDLRGLILESGKPGMFIAGADLKELANASPDHREPVRHLIEQGLAVLRALESLPFPTVALIDGAALGGGLEVALACDYRLAGTNPRVEMGLPEVRLGLIPGWGGTQRLPRIVGPAVAVNLICTGDTFPAERAREIGLVEAVVGSDALRGAGMRLLSEAASSGAWQEVRARKQRPVGLSDEELTRIFSAARAQVHHQTKGHIPAPWAALDVIAAGCNLPLAEGLKLETDAFLTLAGSEISRNLIAVFFMKQRAAREPGVSENVAPKPARKAGVAGAGVMGSGIAGVLAAGGVSVVLADADPAALERGIVRARQVIQRRADRSKLSPAEGDALLARVQGGGVADFAGADLAVEAVVEDEAVKIDTLRQMEAALSPGAVLASNTSTLSITRMASHLSRPEDFAGLHFFNPADRMALVEVVRGEKTSDATVVTLTALARRLGKTPVVVRDGPGFLVNRVLFPYLNEAFVLVEEGALPRAVDQAAVAYGMPMGPLALCDVIGLDVIRSAMPVLRDAFPDRYRPTRLPDELVKAGRLGQKSGAGFYRYPKGHRPEDDPDFAPILEACRLGNREVGEEEITRRLFDAMRAEAERALADGVVRSADELNVALMLGIGFPAFRGGLAGR